MLLNNNLYKAENEILFLIHIFLSKKKKEEKSLKMEGKKITLKSVNDQQLDLCVCTTGLKDF